LLDINSRAEFLWNFSPLDERREDGWLVLLYSLPGFYAEVFYDGLDNRIVKIRGFNSLQPLAAYLNKVD
jgi:hypothetical protein